MHRIRRNLDRVVVEGGGQDLEGEAGRDPVHALVDAGRVLVFLQAAGARIDLAQALAVIDPHLRVEVGVLVRPQARQDREPGQHLQRGRRAGSACQFRAADQLLVDLLLLRDPQAVGHLDHVDAVDERLVVLVGAEGLPFRFVGVGQDDARERDGADILRADIVALLRGREQGVEHLDRRLEHLDEFEDALVRPVEAAGIAVGIGIVLGERLELADVDLADEGRDVLVVLVARLRLGDADLPHAGRVDLDHPELGNVALELVEPLDRPGAEQIGQAPPGNAVALLQHRTHLLRIEQPERALEDRADLVAGLQHIDGVDLHQRLQTLGQGGLAAADRTEQVEDLLALLQALRSVAEEADDHLDRLFHAVEFGEGRIDPDRAVHEDAAEPRILRGIDELRLADGRQDALRSACIHHGIGAAPFQVFRQGHLRLAAGFIGLQETREQVVGMKHGATEIQSLSETTIVHR